MPDWTFVKQHAVQLARDYNAEGICPTLRQVHYRLASVQAGGYQNLQRHYKRLSQILVKARKHGDLSWDALADHVRYQWWLKPEGEPNLNRLVEEATRNVGEDPWISQQKQIIMWLEKDALAELVWSAVSGLHVPLCVSRGYSSWTFVADTSNIIEEAINQGRSVHLLVLTDHDPSGLDIQRFTQTAFEWFGYEFGAERVALTYDQIKCYELLPNPTKRADPRSKDYISKFGDRCWELDALEPKELQRIVRDAIMSHIQNPEAWDKSLQENRRKANRTKLDLMRKLGLIEHE